MPTLRDTKNREDEVYVRREKAIPSEQRKLVMLEVRHQEEAASPAKAVTQVQRGQWTNLRRNITWRELWEMEANRITFMIRATYDVLLSTSGWGKIHHVPYHQLLLLSDTSLPVAR